MSQTSLRRSDFAPIAPGVDVDALAFLRAHWARCRGLARSDLFACRPDCPCTPDARAEALLRTLTCADALGGLRLYQPGTEELSFDEKWLLAALDAATRGDTDSLAFLLNSRLKRQACRQVGALIMALARSRNCLS